MGGAPEARQIFRQGEKFAALVDRLRLQPKGEPHGLVLNGDLVDFLAEPDALYFDPQGASRKLDRIIGDAAFKPVWKALRQYVKTKDRALVLTLGNHDLELALPSVRRQLLQELAQGDDAAAGRITFAFEQEGYRARVGNAEVLCVHGNEVDIWNVTDYEQLRRVGRDLDRGVPLSPWVPNAGSKLVVDVMNSIKRRYAFVDLLKPETQAVLPTLLVLDPSQAKLIGDAIPAVFRLGWDRLRRTFGFLEHEIEVAPIGQNARGSARDRMLVALLDDTFGASPAATASPPNGGELLRRAEINFQDGVPPRALLRSMAGPEFLNVRRAIWDVIRRKGRSEVLREALEQLAKDTSFDRSAPDAAFKALKERIPKSVHLLTAGHTHLERAHPMGDGRFYFNTGTWVRLMQLGPDVLADEARFKPVYDAIDDGNMETLDKNKMTLLRPTVAAFWADDRVTHGALQAWVDEKLQTIDETHFTRE